MKGDLISNPLPIFTQTVKQSLPSIISYFISETAGFQWNLFLYTYTSCKTNRIFIAWCCQMYHLQRMEENRIPKRVLYMNLETIRPRGRPRNRWLDEMREDGRMVGGEEWQEKVYDREEWRRLLRTAKNHRILFMPMDWLIDWLNCVGTRRPIHRPGKVACVSWTECCVCTIRALV